MASLQSALDYVLKNEGGLNEKTAAADPGGLTNYGISLRFLRTVQPEALKKYGIFDDPVNEQTIRELTLDVVKRIYEGEFWLPNRLNEILSQSLADYVFDCIVNHGATLGIKFLQRAVWAVDGYQAIKDDGVIGSRTLHAVNICEAPAILAAMRSERAGWIRAENNQTFNEGWLRRAYDDSVK
jgi:lysozyme family protein